MADKLQEMEDGVLRMLLRADDPVLMALQIQLAYPHSRTRELTGVGFFTYFRWPSDVPPIPGLPSFEFGDVQAEVKGVEYDIGFVLFVKNGLINMLDGHTYHPELWPTIIHDFKLSYINGNVRNIDDLKKTTKWPNL